MSDPPRRRGRARKVNRRKGARRRSGAPRSPRALGRGLARVARTAQRMAIPALAGAAALTLLWVAAEYVRTGPYFRVRKAEMHGLHRLSPDDVLSAARLRLQVSSTLGLDVEAIKAGLRKHPWIVDAEVERWLPDRMVFRVTERVPEAVVIPAGDGEEAGAGRPMLADAYGRRFVRPERPMDVDLPAITGVDVPEAGFDEAFGVADRRLKAALAAMREWRRQGLDALDDLSEVHVDKAAGLTLYTQRDGTAIRLGRREHPARLARVRSVLADIHARGERADYVLADDTRDGARVVVRTAPRRADGAADANRRLDEDGAQDGLGEQGRSGNGTQG